MVCVGQCKKAAQEMNLTESQPLQDPAPIDPEMLRSLLLQWWDFDHSDLPWRRNKDAYAVWIAEVMLQQTQIATVIPYYERWMERLPTVNALAEASIDDVLKLWEGLGYYSRARNLHAAAVIIMEELAGRMPAEVEDLLRLPGIGRYTAGAISSIAFDRPAPVLDGNIVRVLSRLTDLGEDVTLSMTRRRLWKLASDLVPTERPGEFNQALMELGQRLCTPSAPRCGNCPLSTLCLSKERGTQYERPVRPPRKRTPHYNVVAGVIYDGDEPAGERFLIARRPFDKMLGGLWEFPGGKTEGSESYEAALKREIEEELAIEIQVGGPLCTIAHAYTHFRITLHVFLAKHTAGTPRDIEVAEHAWVSLGDVDRFAFAATDRQIIAALQERARDPAGLADASAID